MKYFLCILLLMITPSAYGATYYVCDTGTTCGAGWVTGVDTNSGASKAAALKTVSAGLGKLISGDTLILGDGVYKGPLNMMSEYSENGPIYPPSGTAGNYTTVQAEHIGGAILDAEYKYAVVSNINMAQRKREYVHFDGIHFRHGSYGVFNFYGDYNWISNCGFEDGQAVDNEDETYIAAIAGGSSYCLVEDCWVWGKGRYGLYTTSADWTGAHVGTHHIIFRRVVVRLDNTPVGWMTAALRFYGSTSNVMQNCIVIDGNWNIASAEFHAIATGGGSSNADNNDAFYGNIILNNPLTDCFWPERATGSYVFSNNVCWGNDRGVIASQDYIEPFELNTSSNTIGGNLFSATNGMARKFDMAQNYGYPIRTTKDLFFTSAGGSTWLGGSTIVATAPDMVYLRTGASLGTPPASGYTSTSGAIKSTLYDAGLRYLPRVETGSALYEAGVGANLMFQIGGIGTYYGRPGWSDITSNHLWPYANEHTWAAKMATYSMSGPGGNRGFAALAATTTYPLTEYIWNYLDNSPHLTLADLYTGVSLTNAKFKTNMNAYAR